jgi:hypothetical protein
MRGLVLPSFHFLSFSPYIVIGSSYSNKYLEPLCPHLSSYLYLCPCLYPYSCPQLYSSPHLALPLSLSLCSPASALCLISLLLNMDPLQLLYVIVLEM